jgi:bacterioferritin-associated ferredoxin
MYVCICHGITDRAIHEARDRGISSIEQLGAETGCGSTCGSCRPLAAQLLADGNGSGAAPRHGGLTLAINAAA